jgi:hypothetical protein
MDRESTTPLASSYLHLGAATGSPRAPDARRPTENKGAACKRREVSGRTWAHMATKLPACTPRASVQLDQLFMRCQCDRRLRPILNRWLLSVFLRM